jgi:predicted O-methyltransferase YrrM
MTELCEIATKHRADKATTWGYTPIYFEWLNRGAQTVLEIGVYGGASLFTWRDFFPEARIYGVDIDMHYFEPDGDARIKTITCDAYNRDVMAPHLAAIGPIDFIVDDCVHMKDEQVELLNQLWPSLRPGGVYAIEETLTGSRNAIMAAINGLPDVRRYMCWFAQDVYWLTLIERRR